MLEFAHFGEEREINATDGELKIIQGLSVFPELEIVRKSDNYLTAVYHGCDIMRFKWTSRAKWLMFPVFELGGTKNRIESTDISPFLNTIQQSIDYYKKTGA